MALPSSENINFKSSKMLWSWVREEVEERVKEGEGGRNEFDGIVRMARIAAAGMIVDFILLLCRLVSEVSSY